MKRLAAAVAVAALVLVAGGAAADTFAVRLVSQTATTITLGWEPQPGYGYMFSLDDKLVSRTNDPNRDTVKFSKGKTYEVAVIVKGAIGVYPTAPPPPAAKLTQTIVNGSTIPNIDGWRATYDVNSDGVEDDPGKMVFLVDGIVVLTEESIPFGDTFADGSIVVTNGSHAFQVQAFTDADALVGSNTVNATVNAGTPPPPPPPPSGFPGAANTGVPAGTVLTAYTGPSSITAAGTVIDGKTIGCLDVSAANVTIRNSKISCGGGDYYALQVLSGSVLVEDSDIDCQSRNANGLGIAHITVRRVDISLCENGLNVQSDVTVEDSYIHDLFMGNSAHADGMQFGGAAFNVTIRHNTIFGMGSNGAFGTSSLIADLAGHHDWLIENNLFGGGAYTIYCPLNPDPNWVFRNNAFTKRFGPKYGAFGPAYPSCGDEASWTGNYDVDTGAVIPRTG